MSASVLPVERALLALGELLAAEEASASLVVVVVGGAALIVLGFVDRATQDVDVIASRSERGDLAPPVLSEGLLKNVRTVARDLGLDSDWLNVEVAAQWVGGMPPGLSESLVWRRYGTLNIGYAGREVLIALKLFAAVDGGPSGVHFQDLVRLDPSSDELQAAATWVRSQDASEAFGRMVGDVVAKVMEGR